MAHFIQCKYFWETKINSLEIPAFNVADICIISDK